MLSHSFPFLLFIFFAELSIKSPPAVYINPKTRKILEKTKNARLLAMHTKRV